MIIIKDRLLGSIETERIMHFLLEKKQPEGGFSFSRLTSATIDDTFYAYKIIKSLGANYDFASDYNYVKNLKSDMLETYRKIYFYRQICKAIGSEPKAIMKRNTISLQEKYYASLIGVKTELNQKTIDNYFDKMNAGKLHLKDLMYLLHILKENGNTMPYDAIARYIEECQNGDYGFGFYKGTTSFMENVHYALECYRIIGIIPASAFKSRNFIDGCRQQSGAYARQSNSLANIESTYHAILSIRILDEA